MKKIITKSEVQKKIGEISENIGSVSYVGTRHGKGNIVMLPYFDGCMDSIEDIIWKTMKWPVMKRI